MAAQPLTSKGGVEVVVVEKENRAEVDQTRLDQTRGGRAACCCEEPRETSDLQRHEGPQTQSAHHHRWTDCSSVASRGSSVR